MQQRKLKGAVKRRPIYSGALGAVARAVDAAVGLAFPQRAHKMRVARMESSALVAFEAAQITRTSPRTQSGSADSEVIPNLAELRNLSRTMERDDAHASSIITLREECIVGEGIIAQACCTPAETGLSEDECKAWNDACTLAFSQWANEEADATGLGDFYEQQVLMLRACDIDGDGFSHALIGGDGVIACELIDADRVESPGSLDTQTIRMGVELGPHGEHVAYWVLDNHPEDVFFGGVVNQKPTRHAAKDVAGYSIVQQLYRRKRAGQTRGLPLLTPSLLYTRHLHHYLDSELIAARAASNIALFIKRSVTPEDEGILPVQGEEEATETTYLEKLSSGTVEYLNEGEEPVPFNPNRPGSNFDPFVTRLLRAVSSSAGLSYEAVARDYGKMNLATTRAMLREIRRGFDLSRKRLVRAFCQPWYRNVIRIRVAYGKLDAPEAFLRNPGPFLRCRWVPPSYGMVDPTTDVEASDAAVRANMSTPQEEAARYGRDSSTILRQRAQHLREAMDLEAEYDLPPGSLTAPLKAGTAMPGSANSGGAADPSQNPADQPADPHPQETP